MEKKLRWGEAKKQVITLWPEIGPELEKGATLRSIFHALTQAGKISMSERPFYSAVKNLRANAIPPPPKSSVFG